VVIQTIGELLDVAIINDLEKLLTHTSRT